MMILILLSVLFGCIIICFAVLMIWSPGKMTPFTNENGTVLNGSLSEKSWVELNGVEMGMIIKAKDQTKPVLLFIHGGPGMPEYWLTKNYPTFLEDYFTVVWWDQRGSGLSYSSDISPDTMTTQQSVEDTIAVTNYLRKRFHQEKIYLMAHSFGTYIGIQAAEKAPELYQAYISVAQVSNQDQSEQLAYDYMLDYYVKKGDLKTVSQLEAAPYGTDAYEQFRDQVMHQAGIGTTHKMDSVISGIFMPVMKNREYTLTEKINIWRGKAFSQKTVLNEEFKHSDLSETVTSLEIPIYFFSGKYDYTVNRFLTEAYFEKIQAPEKHFYLFEESAHSPIFEEPEKTIGILTRISSSKV